MQLNWSDIDLYSVLPIGLSVVCFYLYWFIAHSENIKKRYYARYDFNTASSKHIFFTKLTGFTMMGLVPAMTVLLLMPQFSLFDYGLALIPETNFFVIGWIAGLGSLLFILAFMTAGKKENLDNYPQVRATLWTNKIIAIYALGWVLYLLGYEFLFRGVLLVPLVFTIGLWPAIAINVALYSATHLPKGLKETIGAIPLGFVLCLLTVYSGNIWIAFSVHLMMALTNSFRALYLHPDLHYQSKSN